MNGILELPLISFAKKSIIFISFFLLTELIDSIDNGNSIPFVGVPDHVFPFQEKRIQQTSFSQ